MVSRHLHISLLWTHGRSARDFFGGGGPEFIFALVWLAKRIIGIIIGWACKLWQIENELHKQEDSKMQTQAHSNDHVRDGHKVGTIPLEPSVAVCSSAFLSLCRSPYLHSKEIRVNNVRVFPFSRASLSRVVEAGRAIEADNLNEASDLNDRH